MALAKSFPEGFPLPPAPASRAVGLGTATGTNPAVLGQAGGLADGTFLLRLRWTAIAHAFATPTVPAGVLGKDAQRQGARKQGHDGDPGD